MQLLRAEHIHKSYRKNQVLKGINLQIDSGSLVGVVGENGSGKTTLIKILAGELTPDKGRVDVNGSIGYCPQQPIVNKSLTVDEHLDFFRAAYQMPDMSYPDKLLDELNLGRFRKQRAQRLSGGTFQKLNLTLALMHQPSILLLDEPYQGFDWDTYLRFWRLVDELRNAGKAVMVITHLLYDHKKFDYILQLKGGHAEDLGA